MEENLLINFDPELVKSLQRDGLLVDPYSEEWIEAHPEFSSLKGVKDGVLPDVKGKAAHHLLVIFAPEENRQLKERLVKAFPILAARFARGIHHPDFLFINHVERRIISAGLGRKCRLFVASDEPNGYLDVDDYLAKGEFDKISNATLKKFVALDYLGVFRHVVGLLDAYGVGSFYGPPELVVQARKGLKKFIPICDPATLNTHDF